MNTQATQRSQPDAIDSARAEALLAAVEAALALADEAGFARVAIDLSAARERLRHEAGLAVDE